MLLSEQRCLAWDQSTSPSRLPERERTLGTEGVNETSASLSPGRCHTYENNTAEFSYQTSAVQKVMHSRRVRAGDVFDPMVFLQQANLDEHSMLIHKMLILQFLLNQVAAVPFSASCTSLSSTAHTIYTHAFTCPAPWHHLPGHARHSDFLLLI